MLSIAKLANGHGDYFLGLSRYYTRGRKKKRRRGDGDDSDMPGGPFGEGEDDEHSHEYLDAVPGEPPGIWYGKGAERLGLVGEVLSEDYRRLAAGFHPQSGKQLVQNAGEPSRVPGWDFCFSAPKSLSILWGQDPYGIGQVIQRLHEEAVRTTVAFMEKMFACTRKGKAAEQLYYQNVDIVVAAFQHSSSRAKDVNLHTHAVLINLGLDAEGRSGAIDSRVLWYYKMLLGAYYRATLAAAVRRRTRAGAGATGTQLWRRRHLPKTRYGPFHSVHEDPGVAPQTWSGRSRSGRTRQSEDP